MNAAPLVCTKDEQRSVVRFYRQKVCKLPKFTCIFVHSLGTMLFLGKVCTIEEKCLRKATQMWLMKSTLGLPSTWTSNKDIWSCQIHGSWGEKSLLRKWHRNLTLSRGHCIQECAAALGSTRCVQDGFPGNWQKSLSTLLWTFASVTWNVITAE
jgi:hypothetical protein